MQRGTRWIQVALMLSCLIFLFNISAGIAAEITLTVHQIVGNSGVITIHYTTSDPQGASLATTNWAYSTDGGQTWFPIDVAAIGNNNSKPPGSSTITWDTRVGTNNLANGFSPSILFRMQVSDPNDRGSWQAVAPMPGQRCCLGSVGINGKLYVIGGDFNAALSRLEVYDPTTDLWQTLTPMPTARRYLAAVALNGKLYAIGGVVGPNNLPAFSTVEVYDPTADSWQTVAPMPTARIVPAAVAVGGKLYVIGGIDGINLSTVEVYDPVTDTWQTAASMPTPRDPTGSVVDGKIYAVGGWNNGPISTVEVYDPSTDSWQTGTPMPFARYSHDAAVVDERLYVVGGSNGLTWISNVEMYDLAMNSWQSMASMPTARSRLAVAAVNEKIYAVGGFGGGDASEEFTPPRYSNTATSNSLTIDNSLQIATQSLPDGVAGIAYSQTLQATGGTPPYGWSITAGNLPNGLSLGTSTGVISGIPVGGIFSFTASVTDSVQQTVAQGLSINSQVSPYFIPDGDVTTLINIINAANNEAINPGTDTINLAGGTYTLVVPASDSADTTITGNTGPNGFPRITSEIVINGSGSIIEKNTTAPDFRIFEITSGGNLTLNDLTIQNGSIIAPGGGNGGGAGGGGGAFGGAIFNRGILTLNNITLTSNSVKGGNGGGGSTAGFGGGGGGFGSTGGTRFGRNGGFGGGGGGGDGLGPNGGNAGFGAAGGGGYGASIGGGGGFGSDGGGNGGGGKAGGAGGGGGGGAGLGGALFNDNIGTVAIFSSTITSSSAMGGNGGGGGDGSGIYNGKNGSGIGGGVYNRTGGTVTVDAVTIITGNTADVNPDTSGEVPLADTTPPTILATNPQDGATDVPIEVNYTIEFSEPMNQQSVRDTKVTLTDMTTGESLGSAPIHELVDLGLIEASFNPEGTIFTLTSPFPLEHAHDYQIHLTDIRATDVAGNLLAIGQVLFNFTTLVPAPQLEISVSDIVSWVNDSQTFSATLTNIGEIPLDFTAIQITGVDWVSPLSSLNPLPSGETHDFWFVLNVPSNATGGPFSNPVDYPLTLEAQIVDGTTFTQDFNLQLLDSPVAILDVQVIDAVSGAPLSGADVVLESDGTSRQTDSTGHLTLLTTPGPQRLFIFKSTYLPKSETVNLSPLENQIAIVLEPGEVFSVGQVSTTPLTEQEIIDAGINLEDPENNWVYEFEITLQLETVKFPPIILPKKDSGIGPSPPRTGIYHPPPKRTTIDNREFQVIPTVDIRETNTVYSILLIPGEIKLLKEFFEVTTIMKNDAIGPDFEITDVSATLSFPSALALPDLEGLSQPPTIPIGTIPAGGEASATWIVRGDAQGTHLVNVDTTGTLQPFGSPLTASNSGSVEVFGKPTLAVEFQVPEIVIKEQEFMISMDITNTSPIPVHQVSVELFIEDFINVHLALGEQASKNVGTIPPNTTVENAAEYRLIADITGFVQLTRSSVATDPLLSTTLSITRSSLHVSTTGSDELGDGTQFNPWRTIQHAIDEASDGDTLVVLPGVYEENILIDGKVIHLQGENRESKIIVSSGNAVTFRNVSNGTLEGFTINAQINGIVCEDANLAIIDNLIEQNATGIHCTNSSPFIRANTILENDIGIELHGTSHASIFSNVIQDNRLAGISIQDESAPLIGGSLESANDIFDRVFNATDNDIVRVFNATDNDIVATHNYWGTTVESEILPKIDQDPAHNGSIIFEPWTDGAHAQEFFPIPPGPSNQPPTLEFANEPGFGQDLTGSQGVDPDVLVNILFNPFAFKVVYNDEDNDAPTNISLIIEGIPPIEMDLDTSAPAQLNNLLYNDKEQYVHDSTITSILLAFAPGVHDYHFESSDGINPAVRLPETGELQLEVPVPPPSLSYSTEREYASDPISPGVRPKRGAATAGTTRATPMRLKVVYTHPANKAPTSLMVNVGDGVQVTPYAMALDNSSTTEPQLTDGDYTNGEQYRTELQLPSGTHEYHFTASDGVADPVRLPDTGELSFETVKNLSYMRFAVILAEPSDTSFDDVHNRAFYETEIIPQVKDYYCEVAFGTRDVSGECRDELVEFDFDIYDNGGQYYNLPEKLTEYGKNFKDFLVLPTEERITFIDGNGAKITTPLVSDRTLQLIWDAINQADTDIYYNDYQSVLVVHAGDSHQFKGFFGGNLPDTIAYGTAVIPSNSPGETSELWITVSENELVGIWAHEIGHIFGSHKVRMFLPDLYEKEGSSGNIGIWGLMGKGNDNGDPRSSTPAHISSWTKKELGWFDSTLHNLPISTGMYTINGLVTKPFNDNIKVHNLTPDGSQYYILEARTNKAEYNAWDTGLPRDVLLTYMVETVGTQEVVNIISALPTKKKGLKEFKDDAHNVAIHAKDFASPPDPFAIKVEIKSHTPKKLFGAILKSSGLVLNQLPQEGKVLSSGEESSVADLDLHAYTPDGLHVGMNYETGVYENEIPGANTLGDLIYGEEWIFVPEGTQVEFHVSTHDVLEFVNENPITASELSSTQESYEITAIEYDGSGVRYESPTVVSQLIDPGVVVIHEITGSLTTLNLTLGEIVIPQDVTDESELDNYGFRFNRRTGQFASYATWKNTGTDTFHQPLIMVIESINNPAVTIANADGITTDGKPYFDFSGDVGDGVLDPGETSAPKTVIFNNPMRARFNFTHSFMAVK